MKHDCELCSTKVKWAIDYSASIMEIIRTRTAANDSCGIKLAGAERLCFCVSVLQGDGVSERKQSPATPPTRLTPLRQIAARRLSFNIRKPAERKGAAYGNGRKRSVWSRPLWPKNVCEGSSKVTGGY